jgi:hypothetical protein
MNAETVALQASAKRNRGKRFMGQACYFTFDPTQFVVEPPDFADPSIRSPLTCPVYSVVPAVNVI